MGFSDTPNDFSEFLLFDAVTSDEDEDSVLDFDDVEDWEKIVR